VDGARALAAQRRPARRRQERLVGVGGMAHRTRAVGSGQRGAASDNSGRRRVRRGGGRLSGQTAGRGRDARPAGAFMAWHAQVHGVSAAHGSHAERARSCQRFLN
jgi:hypothetical protein